MDQQLCVILITFPNIDNAATFAETLVQEKLCACVNIIPGVQSIYLWEGALCKETEMLLMLKTTKNNLKVLETRVKELHPYQTPEFVVIHSDYASKEYLDWVAVSCSRR